MNAYLFSAQAHTGQTRKSGEAYLTHPLAVADILADLEWMWIPSPLVFFTTRWKTV